MKWLNQNQIPQGHWWQQSFMPAGSSLCLPTRESFSGLVFHPGEARTLAVPINAQSNGVASFAALSAAARRSAGSVHSPSVVPPCNLLTLQQRRKRKGFIFSRCLDSIVSISKKLLNSTNHPQPGKEFLFIVHLSSHYLATALELDDWFPSARASEYPWLR